MRKILVVDDDQVILDLLSTVLADAGYDAVLATGADAIPANANPDLVITDLLPLKGYQRDTALAWVASLRTRFANASVFVLTAHRAAASETDRLGVVLERPNEREDRGGLLAAHHADPRVRPHPELPRRVRASGHAVVSRAKGPPDDHRELGHRAACHGGDHLRSVLRDAAGLVLLPDHEPRDVL